MTLFAEVPEVDADTARDVLVTELVAENSPKTIVLADKAVTVVVSARVVSRVQPDSVRLVTSICSQARQKVDVDRAVCVTAMVEGSVV